MSHNAKILWGEGLFLRPQLFQQQDRYHEARLSQMSQLLQPYAWGIQRLKLDKASLALGTLRVLEVSAVFPGGELYSAPEGATLPSAIGLQDLPLNVPEITTYLALPRLNPHGRNLAVSDSGANAGRYAQNNEQTADMFTEAEEGKRTAFAPHWASPDRVAHLLRRQVPLWTPALVLGVVGAISFTAFSLTLSTDTQAQMALLDNVIQLPTRTASLTITLP